MNISFVKEDPLNTSIINTDTGALLYEIMTPWTMFGRTTTIQRLDQRSPRVVSQIKWKNFSSDLLSINEDRWTEVNKFLVKESMFSRSRTFMASNGVKYKWKLSSNKFTLVECRSSKVVAQSHNGKRGWLSRNPRYMNLDIMPEIIPFLDIVVLTFVIMKIRQVQQTSVDGGGDAGGGGGDGGGGGGGC